MCRALLDRPERVRHITALVKAILTTERVWLAATAVLVAHDVTPLDPIPVPDTMKGLEQLKTFA
jgi:hypothetical protein